MNRYLILAAVALWIATGLQGYRLGYRASETEHALDLADAQASAFEAAERASIKEAERLALEAERDALAQELMSQAYADPDRDRPALSVGSVRRLNSR
jgi:hypothetical protein